MTIKEYKKMSSSYKNGLKREYKLRYTDDYYYAMKLRGLLLVGISFAIIALLYGLKYNIVYGMVLVVLFILYCFYILFLLYKSHKHFDEFICGLSRNKQVFPEKNEETIVETETGIVTEARNDFEAEIENEKE